MSVILTILIIFAIFLFLGTISEKDKDRQRSISDCFIVCIVAICFMHLVG